MKPQGNEGCPRITARLVCRRGRKSCRTIIASSISAAILLTLSSCGDDPTPIPDVPKQSAATVSPAPQATELTQKEQTALDQAVADNEEGQRQIAKFDAKPVLNEKTVAVLDKYTFSPARNDIAKDIADREKLKVTLTGMRKTAWMVPVKVDLDSKTPTIEWLKCLTPGDLKVVRDGDLVPQKKTNQLIRITSNLDPDRFWRLTDSKQEGTC